MPLRAAQVHLAATHPCSSNPGLWGAEGTGQDWGMTEAEGNKPTGTALGSKAHSALRASVALFLSL